MLLVRRTARSTRLRLAAKRTSAVFSQVIALFAFDLTGLLDGNLLDVNNQMMPGSAATRVRRCKMENEEQSKQAPEQPDEIDLDEFLGWAEFCAWAALVMTPIIWWLQGESVSTDQFVVRCSLVVISACVGVGLRARAMCRRRK